MVSVRVVFGSFLFYFIFFHFGFLYFGGVFNKTIIPLTLVGYEMVIAKTSKKLAHN